jgi:hypothetical protein
VLSRSGNEFETVLKLLRFYSFLSDLLRDSYPNEMTTGIAPSIGQEGLEKMVREVYEWLLGSPRSGLPTDGREKVKEDFRRVTELSKRIATASPETYAALLRKYKKEKKYLNDKIREHLSNEIINNFHQNNKTN